MSAGANKGLRALLIFAVASFFGLFLLLIGGQAAWQQTAGQEVEQPINFPHTKHAGDLGLACTYCHLSVEQSRHAGAPPLSVCMGCHANVATDKPEIQKLTRYYNEKTPVEWVRIHNLPPFIYFSHKRHLKGGVDCVSCHGAVPSMAKVVQVRTLKMGWCVSCHRTYNAPLDCSTCHL